MRCVSNTPSLACAGLVSAFDGGGGGDRPRVHRREAQKGSCPADLKSRRLVTPASAAVSCLKDVLPLCSARGGACQRPAPAQRSAASAAGRGGCVQTVFLAKLLGPKFPFAQAAPGQAVAQVLPIRRGLRKERARTFEEGGAVPGDPIARGPHPRARASIFPSPFPQTQVTSKHETNVGRPSPGDIDPDNPESFSRPRSSSLAPMSPSRGALLPC